MAAKKRKRDLIPNSDDEDVTTVGAVLKGMESVCDVVALLQSIQTLAEYPAKPAEHFARRAAEILILQNGAGEMRAALNALPKDLLDLCIAYYEETAKIMMERTIQDFQFFADRKIITQVIAQSSPALRPRLTRLIAKLDRRGPAYLWWFHMRLVVPSFIPLGDLEMGVCGNQMDHCCLWDDNGKQLAAMCLNVRIETPIIVGLRYHNTDLTWTPLIEFGSLPHADLIGPCLDTSKITLEQLNVCAVALSARSFENKDKWLSRLFDLVKGLAAIRLWISDVDTFEDAPDPERAQTLCALAWNQFHKKFRCGEAFAMITKNKAKN
jgi:hypothetical protein